MRSPLKRLFDLFQIILVVWTWLRAVQIILVIEAFSVLILTVLKMTTGALQFFILLLYYLIAVSFVTFSIFFDLD